MIHQLRTPSPLCVVGAGVMLAIFASGCGESEGTETETIRVAWISKGKCNTFFDASRFGARLAAVDLTAEGDALLELELLEPDDCTKELPKGGTAEECAPAAAQMAAVDAALAGEYDAIAISVANPTCVGPQLDRAVDAGRKVVTFDSDAPESKRHTYYGMDNAAAARFLVDQMALLLGGSGKVAIQTSMQKDADGHYQLSQSTTYRERMRGIEQALAEYPDLELVATVPCEGNEPADPACALQVETLLEEHADLSGLILSRGKLLRELELDVNAPLLTAAIEAGSLKSVAFDAPDDALDNIEAGYARMVIAQKQFGWGYDVVRLAHSMVVHELQPPDFYDSSWYLVCPDNLDDYRERWNEHDFRGELPACKGVE